MRAKDYIEAGYTQIAQGKEVGVVLHNVKALLAQKGLLKLYPRVLRGLSEKVSRKNKTESTVLVVARDIDVERHKDEIETALSHIGGSEGYTTLIDPTVIGGFMVTGRGRRIDHTHKSTLLHVYQKVAE